MGTGAYGLPDNSQDRAAAAEQNSGSEKGRGALNLMSSAVRVTTVEPSRRSYWFARHSKPLIFLILTLAALGVYWRFSIPVAVFPTTNFPRVLIAADNGVMPIDQMMVTVTRPIEEAVNSVPGLQEVRSITSRGSAEIDLFFDWNMDMFQTLQYVNAGDFASAAGVAADGDHRHEPNDVCQFPDHRLQPDFGYGATNATVGIGDLRNQATAEPFERRLERGGSGRAGAGIPY